MGPPVMVGHLEVARLAERHFSEGWGPQQEDSEGWEDLEEVGEVGGLLGFLAGSSSRRVTEEETYLDFRRDLEAGECLSLRSLLPCPNPGPFPGPSGRPLLPRRVSAQIS